MDSLANTFDFNSLPVRTFYRDNEIWFAAVDVCRILEIANPSDAISKLDEDEKTENNTLANNDGIQTAGSLSQYGKPQAKAFKKWITSEVLPSIRKTGGYQTKPSRDVVEYTEVIEKIPNLRCSEALKQLLLDKAGDELSSLSKNLLSPAKVPSLIGVAQKAEQMGYTLTHANRGILGKYVKRMGLNPISEDRLVNGQLRKCLVYEDNSALESAITNFFSQKV